MGDTKVLEAPVVVDVEASIVVPEGTPMCIEMFAGDTAANVKMMWHGFQVLRFCPVGDGQMQIDLKGPGVITSRCDDFSDTGHGRGWLGVAGNAAHSQGIEWVVAGAESGPGARYCRDEWLINLAHQCDTAGIPYFCKQSHQTDGNRVKVVKMPELDTKDMGRPWRRVWDEVPW